MGNIQIIKFSAERCGPCKLLKPILDEVKTNYPDIEFIDIDVDKNQQVAELYNIRSIPTIIIRNEEKIIGIQKGFLNKEMLIDFINSNVGTL